MNSNFTIYLFPFSRTFQLFSLILLSNRVIHDVWNISHIIKVVDTHPDSDPSTSPWFVPLDWAISRLALFNIQSCMVKIPISNKRQVRKDKEEINSTSQQPHLYWHRKKPSIPASVEKACSIWGRWECGIYGVQLVPPQLHSENIKSKTEMLPHKTMQPSFFPFSGVSSRLKDLELVYNKIQCPDTKRKIQIKHSCLL